MLRAEERWRFVAVATLRNAPPTSEAENALRVDSPIPDAASRCGSTRTTPCQRLGERRQVPAISEQADRSESGERSAGIERRLRTDRIPQEPRERAGDEQRNTAREVHSRLRGRWTAGAARMAIVNRIACGDNWFRLAGGVPLLRPALDALVHQRAVDAPLQSMCRAESHSVIASAADGGAQHM